jgi:hypothetical protein
MIFTDPTVQFWGYQEDVMKSGIGFVVALFLIVGGAFAQSNSHTVTLTVNEISLIAVNGTPSLTIGAPAAAGDPPANVSDNTSRLVYTVTVPSGKTKEVQVAWAGGDSNLTGTTLSVVASGLGTNQGTGGTEVPIGTVATNLITTVGTCYTGSGAGAGAVLTYWLKITNAASLVTGTKNVTVTYTLTAAH